MARRSLRDITSALTIGPYSALLLINRSAYGLLSDEIILNIPMPVIDYLFPARLPTATRNITLLPSAWGEKKSVTASS